MTTDANPFSSPAELPVQSVDRRRLVPWWVKAGSWISCVLALTYPALLFVMESPAESSHLGFRHYGAPTDLGALPIHAMILWGGVVGFGLLWTKRWAVDAGIAFGVVAIVSCAVDICHTFMAGGGSIHLEIVPMGLFVYKLASIRREWMAQPEPVPYR